MTEVGGKTIVLVDDSPLILDTLRVAFESRGYGVRTAATLTELETLLVGLHPDMFILDVQMPEMFGQDLAQVLREVHEYRVPILLYSSVEESSLKERAAEAGVDYVRKQSGAGALVERVRSIFGEGAA